MKIILFLTNAYPYLPGEQFIEEEIGYWDVSLTAKVVLVPLNVSGNRRSTPRGVDVDLSIARNGSIINKLASLLVAVFSRLFWNESLYIWTTKGLALRCYAQALRQVTEVFRIEKGLKRIHTRYKKLDVAYCYWNEIQAYAAVQLKNEGLISKVISRAHGYDLYETLKLNKYMPLKRQFINQMDSILAISNQGKKYLETTYGVLPESILVSRLGVSMPLSMSLASEPHVLNIVSLSFCVPVKRIDRIIDAIALAKLTLKPFIITWTHIGDGPLLADLKLRADEKMTSLQIQWNFLGNKSHADVMQYLENNSIDMFINTSESEGVPVSIMEAMSYGIPAIAPDIGGISELISDECGCLLRAVPLVEDIATSIVDMSVRCKKIDIRTLARQRVQNHYNAQSNYESLVNFIISQAEGP